MAQPGLGGFHGGIFATMKFPKYKFQEYPKRITKPDGSRVRVVDQADELRVKAEIPELRPQTEVERERDAVVSERDGLAQALDAKQAEIAKIREELAAFQRAQKASEAQMNKLTAPPIVPPGVPAAAPKK